MDTEKTKENIGNNKKTIVLCCLFAFALMIIIGFVIGRFLYSTKTNKYSHIDQNTANLNAEENIVNESDNKGNENNNMMVVNVNENNVTNNTNTNTNTNTQTNLPDKPKVVDAPYYIKVNHTANVVTIYKKDNNRTIYSAN